MKINGSKKCPKCGRRPSWVRLYFKKWFMSQWPCPVCATKLRFDPVRKWMAPLIIFFGIALSNHLQSFLESCYFLLALLVVLFIGIPLMDDITHAGNDRKTKKKETAEHET